MSKSMLTKLIKYSIIRHKEISLKQFRIKSMVMKLPENDVLFALFCCLFKVKRRLLFGFASTVVGLNC